MLYIFAINSVDENIILVESIVRILACILAVAHWRSSLCKNNWARKCHLYPTSYPNSRPRLQHNPNHTPTRLHGFVLLFWGASPQFLQ